MKKLLLVSILLLQGLFLIGQVTIDLYDQDDNQIWNGQILEVMVEDLNYYETVSPEIFPKNISNETINVKIRMEEIVVEEETSHYFCGLGNCFMPGTVETPNPYPIAAGELVGLEGFFSSHYSPDGHAGITMIRYTYFNVDDLNDTISFTVSFIGEETIEDPIFKLFDHDGIEIAHRANINVPVDLNIDEVISPELFIMNNTDAEMSIKCRRDVITTVEGTSNYFCALGACLSPDLDETSRELVLGAGETGDQESAFSAHYTSNGNNGYTVLQYTFFNVDNSEEVFVFTVSFASPNAISDFYEEVSLNAYPNPATSFVNISLSDNNIKQSDLVIYNTLGLKVYSQAVNQNSVQLDLSSLERGIYLYRLEGAGTHTATSKLILK